MTTPHIIRVVGMPRSGTAFASMLLALHPDCIAYHELARYDRNWRETIKDSEFDYVADCNTYGFLHNAQIPSQSLIYLDRSVKGSHKASEELFSTQIDITKMEMVSKMMAQWALTNNACVLNEGDIFTLDGMQILWMASFGSFVPFPKEKATELLKLNVQHHNAKVMFGEGVEFSL